MPNFKRKSHRSSTVDKELQAIGLEEERWLAPQRRTYQLIFGAKSSALEINMIVALYGLNRLYLGMYIQIHICIY